MRHMRTGCLLLFSPPNHREWDCRSADQSLRRTAGGFGRQRTSLAAPSSISLCPRSAKRMSDPNSIVFVVDDDPLVRDSVADLLSSAGFAAQTFGSATDFIQ